MTETLVSRGWGWRGLQAAALVAVVALGGGCAAQGDDGVESASGVTLGERVEPGVFKLYGDPGYQASSWCDVHTILG